MDLTTVNAAIALLSRIWVEKQVDIAIGFLPAIVSLIVTFVIGRWLGLTSSRRVSGFWQGAISPYIEGQVNNDERIELKISLSRRITGKGVGLIFFVRSLRSNKHQWVRVQGVDEVDSTTTSLPLISKKFTIKVKNSCLFLKVQGGDWENCENILSNELRCEFTSMFSARSTLLIETYLPLTGNPNRVAWRGDLTKLE